jgi:hypothetical protein
MRTLGSRSRVPDLNGHEQSIVLIGQTCAHPEPFAETTFFPGLISASDACSLIEVAQQDQATLD